MPYKQQQSPFWYASYTAPDGRRVRQSTGTTDRKEAEALEAKWKAEAFKQKAWDETPEVTFGEVILYWLKLKERHENDKLRASILRESFDGMIMNRLSRRDIVAHRNRRMSEGVKAATINRDLAQLSAAINLYNEEMEFDLPNPARGRRLKEPEGRLRWITRAEAGTLIESARQSDKAPYLSDFIILALNTAMRKQEMLGLEWRRVDLQTGLIYLEAEHTKSAKRRTIPINDNAKSALLSRMRYRAEHCPASPWVFSSKEGKRIGSIKRSWATACKRSGIEDFRVHDMRHTCAAWLVNGGRNLQEVRDLLGHSSIKMTERYAHLAPEIVRDAVQSLVIKPGISPA